MKPIADYLNSLGVWNWFIFGAAMLVLEMMIPGLHFIWFGLAAVVLGTILFAVPMSMPMQLFVFAALSVASILFARRYWNPNTVKSDAPDLNDRGLQYVGRSALVVEDIVGGRGRVSLGDTVWAAKGPDTQAGTLVKVTGATGTVLDVERVKG